MPELTEMFAVENQLKSTYLRKDDSGDLYLEFNSDDRRLNGSETIKYLYKWVDSYNCHRAGDVSVKTAIL